MILFPVSPALTVEDATYRDAPAIRLKNDSCELLISPKYGRVVEFRSVGGPNVLWVAPEAEFKKEGYRNVGGDKVWYGPQSLWNWPPTPPGMATGSRRRSSRTGCGSNRGRGRSCR